MSLPADLRAYRDRLIDQLQGAPPEVAEQYIPSLEPSPNTQHAIQSAAQSLPFPLPPSLLQYLTAPVVPGIEWDEIAVPTNEDLASIFSLLNRSELWSVQLAQVAHGPSGDPVCLDFSRPLYDGEYPVLVINHDRVPADGWSDPNKVRTFISLEFSDFAVMLHLCCHGVKLDYRTNFDQ